MLDLICLLGLEHLEYQGAAFPYDQDQAMHLCGLFET
jgi:hypothetical protein